MATSLMRLGLSCRRLKLISNINNETLHFRDSLAVINNGYLSSTNDTICRESAFVQKRAIFCSSCVSAKDDTAWKREFLLKRLDKKKKEKVEVWKNMSVMDLAKTLKKPPQDILEILHSYINEGHVYKTKDDVVENIDVLRNVVKFMNKVPFVISQKQSETETENLDAIPRPPANPKDLVKRSPIVTIMGHVDHGKTTLLDYLRKANVVENEFGGITQHIGAFSVRLDDDNSVTFIDTPGHAAFTSMRSRGANVTDIVVLVVAADDGVMEQTVESIRMAQEAGATIIVAINKIDKPGANVKRTEEMLAQHLLYTENMGGDIQAVPISALNGTNVETLVEAILLQSELMELKADPSGLVEGVIVESRQDLHKGKLATAIILRGTLKKGAILVAGEAHAKVRLMFDESGKQLSKAGPATPVEMMGWRDLPTAGELLLEVQTEKRAHQVLSYRKSKQIETKGLADQKVAAVKMEEHRKLYAQKRRMAAEMGHVNLWEKREKLWVEDSTPKVKVIIKGDVDGSVEAILDVLETYQCSDVPLHIVHYGVGDTTPNDIEMASLFGAIIYCFNVKTQGKLKDEAKEKRISIRHVNVIYHLINDLKMELSTKMPTVEQQEILGEADVIQQFEVNDKRKKLVVAGLRITKGEIFKAEKVKLVRNGTVLFDGSIASLRNVKAEVNSMKSGMECGLMLGDATIPVRLGDTIICYKTKLVQKMVAWDPGF